MSEYQYYEFLAIDKPLTARQIDEVGKYSSRAEITPTSFINEYHYGNFRGSPDEFLKKWYDAMVYTANWGTHRFMFRVPKSAVDMDSARHCCAGEGATVTLAGEHAIFDLESHEEEADWDDAEGSGRMASLIGVRSEFLRGDQRLLYLIWLSAVGVGEVDDGDPEPLLPPGLAKLSASLKSLADFLRIDEDLITAAAEGRNVSPVSDDGLENFIAAIPIDEKNQLLSQFIRGESPLLGAELIRRFRSEKARLLPTPDSTRTAGQLRESAKQIRTAREEAATRRTETKRKQKEAAAAEQRIAHLAAVARRGEDAWNEIETLVACKNEKSYDSAAELVRDLRDVAVQAKSLESFKRRVVTLRDRHARKGNFIAKLDRVLPARE